MLKFSFLFWCLVSLILFNIAGCVSYEKTLANIAGQRHICSASGYGIIGSSIANSKFEECIEKVKAKGFN